MTRQLKGEWRCEAPGLVPLLARARAAARAFDAVAFRYIPRAENARVRPRSRGAAAAGQPHAACPPPCADVATRAQADALANRAMDTRASFDRVHPEAVGAQRIAEAAS